MTFVPRESYRRGDGTVVLGREPPRYGYLQRGGRQNAELYDRLVAPAEGLVGTVVLKMVQSEDGRVAQQKVTRDFHAVGEGHEVGTGKSTELFVERVLDPLVQNIAVLCKRWKKERERKAAALCIEPCALRRTPSSSSSS